MLRSGQGLPKAVAGGTYTDTGPVGGDFLATTIVSLRTNTPKPETPPRASRGVARGGRAAVGAIAGDPAARPSRVARLLWELEGDAGLRAFSATSHVWLMSPTYGVFNSLPERISWLSH